MTIVDEVTNIINRLNDTGYYHFQVVRFNADVVLIIEINFKNWYYEVSYKGNMLYVEFSDVNEIESTISRSQIAEWENIIETILNRERLSI